MKTFSDNVHTDMVSLWHGFLYVVSVDLVVRSFSDIAHTNKVSLWYECLCVPVGYSTA